MTSVLPAKVSLRESDLWHEYQAMALLRVEDVLVTFPLLLWGMELLLWVLYMKENSNSRCEIKCSDHKPRKEGRKTELHLNTRLITDNLCDCEQVAFFP